MRTGTAGVRRARGTELRHKTTDNGLIVEGYATVYDYPYQVAGGPPYGWTEVVAHGAAARAVTRDDVRLLINHDGIPLARTTSNTLELRSDDTGLRMTATLDDQNPRVVELASAMRRGDLNEMSFGFKVLEQRWDDDYTRRLITNLELFDVSLVTYPANPATVAAVTLDGPRHPQ